LLLLVGLFILIMAGSNRIFVWVSMNTESETIGGQSPWRYNVEYRLKCHESPSYSQERITSIESKEDQIFLIWIVSL
jgi:hypothetical protein